MIILRKYTNCTEEEVRALVSTFSSDYGQTKDQL